MESDEVYMRRAIELARRPAFTSPNPRVGCVVVRDGAVVSEGFHAGAGHPHAEAVALDGVDAAGATLYVNLEPCTHEGRTPACAPLVVSSGVARVVVGVVDPFPTVSGAGIRALREAGIEVTVGILEEESRALNAPFIHRHNAGRSMLTLKLAMSLDGRLAAPDGSSQWITSEPARRRVHERRREAVAVMVASGTVVADDPALTVRAVDAPRQPLRVVLDRNGRVPSTARLFSEPGNVMIATTERSSHEQHTAWKEAGAEVIVLPAVERGVDIGALLQLLGERDVLEVYCEAGARLATSLIHDDLVDRLELHYGAVLLGGGAALGDVGVASIGDAKRFRRIALETAGDDVIVTLERRERD
jgi:diaminohydroxyphosphoribosylaminopyrimidine deaminase/5-amino-6-(5-phosphoribosylamino)uracil reductase